MKKFQNNKIFRMIVQLLFFIFLPGLVGTAFAEVKTLFVDLFSSNFASILVDCGLIIVLSISTMILGRFFCGWMCMFGTYNDIVNLIGRKVFKINYHINQKVDEYLKYVKYVVLIFIAGFVWTSVITLPLGSSPWDALAQMLNPAFAFQNYLIGIIILAFITVGDLFIERFFCRYLCPLGAIFSILSKVRILNIKKEKSVCGPCKACTNKCAMGINLDAVNLVRSGECINCLNCTSICPKNNAKMVINDKVLNEYAVATLAVAGTAGTYLGVDQLATTYAPTSSTTETVISKYADGTYTGSGRGYSGTTKVSVVIKNDKITSINLISENDSQRQFQSAWSSIPSKIISSNSTDVSVVSGATYSSEGIISAVEDALSQAEAAKITNSTSVSTSTSASVSTSTSTSTSVSTSTSTSTSTSQKYKDGTYTGSGRGYSGTTEVSVTIANDKITSINLVSENDSQRQFQSAWNSIPSKIISGNSTNVSVVSGATYSSEGIISAVEDALSQAEY